MLPSRIRRLVLPVVPVLAALSALFVLPSADYAPSIVLTTPGQAADSKALTKVDEDWSKVAASKDVDKVVAFYTDDAIAYPPNEPVAIGRAAVKKVWAAYLALPDFAISWKTAHAEVASSGDVGLTAGSYELSFKGPDGKPVAEKGKYLCTWKKQKDGTWKAVHDMWNSDTK